MKTVIPVKSKFIGKVNQNMKMIRGTYWENKDLPEIIKLNN